MLQTISGIETGDLEDRQWHKTFDMMVHPLHELCQADLPQIVVYDTADLARAAPSLTTIAWQQTISTSSMILWRHL